MIPSMPSSPACPIASPASILEPLYPIRTSTSTSSCSKNAGDACMTCSRSSSARLLRKVSLSVLQGLLRRDSRGRRHFVGWRRPPVNDGAVGPLELPKRPEVDLWRAALENAPACLRDAELPAPGILQQASFSQVPARKGDTVLRAR